MVDLVDAMKEVLGLVERFVKLRAQQQERAAHEEWTIENDAEIDGLAEIDRIRAAAGLAPYRGWQSARRPTSGRWSPSSPTGDANATEAREAPASATATASPPEPEPSLDLGPREHVESEHGAQGTSDAENVGDESIDAESIDASIIDAAIIDAAIIDAEIIDNEPDEPVDHLAGPMASAAEEQRLRDALMTAEAARARPVEARRLYEKVLVVATRPGAPYPHTLYAALALLGTSECDLEVGELDAAMANSGDAWAWARRAHVQHPSDETLQVLSLTAQNHAQAAENSGDRRQLAEVLGECLSVIEPELASRDLPAARQVWLGLRSRLMKLTRPATTSLMRKGALTPSLTLTAMQGVRP